MNNSIHSKADGKARFLALLMALCMLTVTSRLQEPDFSISSCTGVEKLHEVESDARQLVQLSIRMYRFYKLTATTTQTHATVN
jgi:hypothetical protein